jgi:hypothetical protein
MRLICLLTQVQRLIPFLSEADVNEERKN